MHALSTSFVLGYHGCDASVAEQLLSGIAFLPSNNDYDWLGPGVYFWEANPRRGLDFAREVQRTARGQSVRSPAVVGAIIELGLCLDLTTMSGVEQIRIAHAELMLVLDKSGLPIPRNQSGGLRRNLDCAVIRYLHQIRSIKGDPPADSVKGIFIEGRPVYEGSGFYEKTHTQICVRDPNRIKGVFRVDPGLLA
ncbi:MAG: hypothetical protein U1E53_26060 [Dongiaceae bacterium]